MKNINGQNDRNRTAGGKALLVVMVIFLGISVGLLAACGEFTAASEMTHPQGVKLKIDNNLQTYGIEVLGVEHPEFDAELRKYLAENGRHAAAINEANRLGILIKNNADREVVGVSLLWTMNGLEARVIPQSQNHPGVLMGMKVLDPAMIGKTSVINVGAARFFSHSGAGQDAGSGVLSLGAPPSYPVSVKLDGVFFDDGTFIGDNKSFYFEHMSGSVKASLDFVTRLNEGVRAGKSDLQIIDEFLAEAPKEYPHPSRGFAGRFKDGKEAFDMVYAGSMFATRKGIERMRTMGRTDSQILDSYKGQKIEDFKTLKRTDPQ